MSSYRELAYNGSGYYDDTCYRAMKKIKEGKTMYDFYNGDIWSMQKQTGAVCEVLIIAKHDAYASVLTLTEKEPKENAVKVKSKSVMYTDAGKISYAFYDNLTDYVKSLPDAEYKTVMEKVGEALDISTYLAPVSAPEPTKKEKADTSTPEPKKAQQVAAEESLSYAEQQNYMMMQERFKKLQIENAAAERECAVYKELLYKALPQLGGATA